MKERGVFKKTDGSCTIENNLTKINPIRLIQIDVQILIFTWHIGDRKPFSWRFINLYEVICNNERKIVSRYRMPDSWM